MSQPASQESIHSLDMLINAVLSSTHEPSKPCSGKCETCPCKSAGEADATETRREEGDPYAA